MNYSRPLDLRKSVVSLDRLVEESLMQLEPLTNGREISIEQNLPKTLPPVLADSDKMRQVLVNVIRNAVEATGRDGRVEITGGVEDSHGRVVVTLEVADNGSGISPQDLGRVFKPFFTTKQKGTGLGLPIVKKILEAHGYAISVSSEEAKGTVVHLQMQGAEE
jgi:signal transduction histidine kinase